MTRFLSEVTSQKRAVLYDELSHMNPRYANPLLQESLNIEQQIAYHERNLILLSLYFDYIVILTGNILNFTNFLTQEVISRVCKSLAGNDRSYIKRLRRLFTSEKVRPPE
jgi:hypothetical protein